MAIPSKTEWKQSATMRRMASSNDDVAVRSIGCWSCAAEDAEAEAQRTRVRALTSDDGARVEKKALARGRSEPLAKERPPNEAIDH